MPPAASAPVLLDCTLRDGGYYNSWDFSRALVEDYLSAMAALPADYVEIGFRSFERAGFKGPCAFTTESFLRHLSPSPSLKLGVMVNAAELSAHDGGPVAALATLFGPAAESALSLVRIACHTAEVPRMLDACAWLKDQGYVVAINCMQIGEVGLREIETLGSTAASMPPDVLYLADSLGGLTPERLSDVVAAVRNSWSGALGVHTHDNTGQALPNTLRALDAGVTWVDSTVLGMGRGPGNARTEHLAIELGERRGSPYNIAPVLSVIARHFEPLRARHAWGTNAFYYLSGKLGIHPTYIQEMLTDSRYGEEDVLAVIEHLREAGGRRFSLEALETGRHFYGPQPSGSWTPTAMLEGREVLIIGAGPGASRHAEALAHYVRTADPVVIALNTQQTLPDDLVHLRAASHPVRLLADCDRHLSLPQPLIAPVSALPPRLAESLAAKTVLDYGLGVQLNTFEFGPTGCVLPTALVIGYVLAVAASGKARRVLLAGFDGYGADDPRTAEMEALLAGFSAHADLPLLAVTPTRYAVPATSAYALV